MGKFFVTGKTKDCKGSKDCKDEKARLPASLQSLLSFGSFLPSLFPRSRLYHRGRYSPTREQGPHHFHRLLERFLGGGI